MLLRLQHLVRRIVFLRDGQRPIFLDLPLCKRERLDLPLVERLGEIDRILDAARARREELRALLCTCDFIVLEHRIARSEIRERLVNAGIIDGLVLDRSRAAVKIDIRVRLQHTCLAVPRRIIAFDLRGC